MKISMMICLCLCFFGGAIAHPHTGGKKDKEAVREAAKSFVRLGDSRDTNGLEALLEKDFRALVTDPESGIAMKIDKTTYLDLMKAGKIGGDTREVEIEKVVINEQMMATVQVRLTGEKAVFHSQYSFIKVGTSWQLVQDLVRMVPNP